MQVRTVWEFDYAQISPSYPTKLKITIFWRRFRPKICMTAPKIVVPDQGENWCRQSWRRKETTDISCTAQFVTTKKLFLYIKPVVVVERTSFLKWRYCDAPLNLASFDLKFWPRIWTHHWVYVQTDGKPPPPFFFRQVTVAFVFFVFFLPIVVSVIPRTKKRGKGEGFPFICWYMTNTVRVKKTHTSKYILYKKLSGA